MKELAMPHQRLNLRRISAWIAFHCFIGLSSLTCLADEPQNLTENTLALADGATGDPAQLDSMAWLAGRWVGTGLGGEVEEIWSPPRNGQMLGMFRFINDDKILLCELLTLTEVDGRLELKVKHFGPDLTGWEEKDESVTFRWVGQSPSRFDFHGLSFRPSEDRQTLKIFLAMKQGEVTNEGTFELRRD